MNRFTRIHDAITTAGFAGGAASVALIAGAFWFEVVSRYFFNAPTSWAYDLASFLLCPTVFLSVPEMARRNAHVAVSYLADGLPVRLRVPLATSVFLVAAVICLVAAWITGAETWRQYARGVETITAIPISKWWVSIFIPYGLLNSGLYFVRHLIAGAPQPALDVQP